MEKSRAAGSDAKRVANGLLTLAVALGVVGCDRVTKDVATESLAGAPAKSYFFDVVRLGYAENPGAFVSLGADLPGSVRFLLFVVGTGLMLLLLLSYAIRHRRAGWRSFGLAVVIAGGASNWVDRLADGTVVDFVSLGVGPLRTAVFNVADVALLTGVLILGVSGFFARTRADVR